MATWKMKLFEKAEAVIHTMSKLATATTILTAVTASAVLPAALMATLCLYVADKVGLSHNLQQQHTADELLFSAIEGNRYVTVERCIASGANVNAKNEEGWSPLELANHKNNREIAHLLALNGARDRYAA